MEATFKFSQQQHDEIINLLKENSYNPYKEYSAFHKQVGQWIKQDLVPKSLREACLLICNDRNQNDNHVHVLSNCPIDRDLPKLNQDDPLNDKYQNKKTFIGESFIELVSQLLETPLFSYQDRNNGDFFTDLISLKKLKGKKSGFVDGDLIFHNDRTCHPVRADYVSLLGLRCPKNQLIYTNYIGLKEMLKHISAEHIDTLKKPLFQTEVDDLTRSAYKDWSQSPLHEIITKDGKLRYQDTLTKPADNKNNEAKDALIALKDAMAKAIKLRHRVMDNDLLIFSNQRGIHNREWVDVQNSEEARERWLLKSYAFEDEITASQHKNWQVNMEMLCMTSNHA